jgi:hypothetical protein
MCSLRTIWVICWIVVPPPTPSRPQFYVVSKLPSCGYHNVIHCPSITFTVTILDTACVNCHSVPCPVFTCKTTNYDSFLQRTVFSKLSICSVCLCSGSFICINNVVFFLNLFFFGMLFCCHRH